MSRRNQRHRREWRYLRAVERQLAAIEEWLVDHRPGMPAPIELFLRPGDKATNYGVDE